MSDPLIRKPFLFFLKQHPRAVFLGMFFLVITDGLDAYWPLLLKKAIDLLEAKAELNDLVKVNLMLVAVMVGLSLTRYGWRRYFGEFHTFAAETLRQRVFNHLNSLSGSFYQKTSVGQLMSLITNDVQSFRQAIGPGFLILMDGFIIMSFILPIMFFLNADWTWKCLIFLPTLPFLIWKVMKLIHSTYKIQQDRFAELTGFCNETVNGIRVIKGFAREPHRSSEFAVLNQIFIRAANKNSLVDSLFGPIMEFGMATGNVILLFVSQADVLSGAVSAGTFLAFHLYIQKMVWPMTALGFGLSHFQKGTASFSRIRELLTTSSDVVDSGNLELKHFENLELRNVSFQYPGYEHWALKDISFRIQQGQSLAIMGSIGSGKSTLFQLLTRYYPLKQGEILINGKKIEQYTLKSLRDVFCLVPQEPFLYSRSVKDNLALQGHRDEMHELIKAADDVQVLGEINTLPSKWDSQLGEKGINLSGGQKQRLTLARALLSHAEVLMFDDVLSAVDTITEEKIERQIFRNTDRTVIVSGHRISTLKNLSHVLVLNQGQVELFGTWKDISKSRTLQTIFNLQEGIKQDVPVS